jgi:hypothetical protein
MVTVFSRIRRSRLRRAASSLSISSGVGADDG